MFVYIIEDKVLFIDIVKYLFYDVFVDKRFFEILDRNWSDVLIEVNDIVGFFYNLIM